MTNTQTQTNRRRVRLAGLVGAGAFVVLGAVGLSGHGTNATGVTLANSGDAPTNTVYVQPSDKAMTMGATATFTTPLSVEQSPSASPAIKGGG